MSPVIDSELSTYVLANSRETDVQRRLRERTRSVEQSEMQISADEAAFLSILVQSIGAKRAIEVGTYTGYSALAIASALPRDGTLVCCDISDKWTSVGRPFWREAGVADRIDLRLGPAEETLQQLLKQGAEGWDFAFIDADKPAYEAYYELTLKLLRPGGLMAIDNTLWERRVLDPSINDRNTAAIRALNARLRDDGRVDVALLTIRDGVTLARKR
jgi:predicted O-methyltransferase YrrM